MAEGVRLVEEALAAGVPFRGVVTDPTLRDTPRGAALAQALAEHAITVEEVPEKELAALADADTPQGVLAAVEPPRWTLEDLEVPARQPVLVLDGVQDPGNVGTLIRTAFALGASAAVLLKGTADLLNPKVMRGGMGATFRLPSAPADENQFARWIADREIEVWASAGQGTPLDRAKAPERLAVVVGNEGAGIRPFIRSLATRQVAVPLARGAESLNVAVAAGVILYDVQHRA